MKKIINILVVLVIVGGVIYFWQNTYRPTAPTGTNLSNDTVAEISQEVESNRAAEPKQTINIEFVFGEERRETVVYELPAAASYSLFALTKGVAEQKNWAFEWKDYGEMGILITKIDQTANGMDNKYWQYYVEDKMPQVAANNYFPKTTDKIKWAFQNSEY